MGYFKYDGVKDIETLGPQFVRIPWVLLDTELWYKWAGTAEAKVWWKMMKHTIRRPMKGSLGKKIFNEYYKKGLICVCWKQEDMANGMGIKSQSHISNLINSMVDKNIIKVHKDKWNNRSINIYEMGTHDNTVSRHENMHLYTYIVQKDADDTIEKFK